MAYAGKIEDLPPEERYADSRLEPLIEQAVEPIWLREILGGFLYKLKQLANSKHLPYDIAVWEVDPDDWKVLPGNKLEPTKIWGSYHPFIPKIDEEIQIDHNLYKVVKVMYDLGDDHIRVLVVKLI